MGKLAVLVMILALFLLAGCAGLNQQATTFTATGHSFNILTFQLPDDPLKLAESKVPEDAEITNVNCSPTDLSTLPGILCRLFGIGSAQIGGLVEEF